MEFWCEKHKVTVYDFCDRCILEKAQADFVAKLDAINPLAAMARPKIEEPKCGCHIVHTCTNVN